MSADSASHSLAALLAMKARVPENVVHRQFAAETVILNLDTGLYHGLNVTGGRMMEVLDRSPNGGGRRRAACAGVRAGTQRDAARRRRVLQPLAERNLLLLEPVV